MENSLAVYNNEKGRKSISFIPEKSEVITLIIDQLKQSTNELIFNQNFYFYEDGFWQKKDEFLIKKFIQNFAYERGFDEKYYKPYKKADDLYNQAMLDFYTEIKTNKNLLNFKNGTYDIDNMVFRTHQKEDYMFYSLPYEFDEKADCPKWKAFIKEVLPQEDLQIAIQEAMGYPLSNLHLEKIVYLVGQGRNGKSVCLDVLSTVLGGKNVSHVPIETIVKNDGKGLQQMENKIINLTYESSSNVLKTEVFKTYVSGEALNLKRLYFDDYTTTNYPQSIVASNSMPHSADFSEGFYRRFRFLPFNVTIEKEKVNPNLKNELCEELAGIANWLLEGVKRLRENKKFTYSPTIEALQNDYRIESDNVLLFLDEKMYIPSLKNKQLLSQLYNEFETFSNGNGYRTMSNRTFSSRMKSLGFKVEKGGTGNHTNVWLEIDSKKEETLAQEKQIIENKVDLLEADDYFPDEIEPPF